MPNHIQNRLQITGETEEVNKLLTSIEGTIEDTVVAMDFNKIKPMPDSLRITSGSLGENAHQLLFGTKQQKFFPLCDAELKDRMIKMSPESRREAVELGLKYQENIEKYGATTWYDWCISNWGTKWNAYGQPDKRNTKDTIFFETAWSSPVSLMEQLSNKFPDVILILTYADEDSGSNVGRIVMKKGQSVESYIPESQSKEAYDIYFDLHPDSRKDYKLVGDRYQYVEEEA